MTITAEEMTAYDCAMEYGAEYGFVALIDTADPPTRTLTGRLHVYHHPDPNIGAGVLLENATSFPEAFKAGYLLDTGVSSSHYIVVGWRAQERYAYLRHPEPGRLITPRRFYHLRLEAA